MSGIVLMMEVRTEKHFFANTADFKLAANARRF